MTENKPLLKKYILKPLILIMILFSLSFFVSALTLPPGVQKLVEYEQELALSVNVIIAFLAGLISITSPCGAALLPTFFSFAFKERKRAMWMLSVFSLGLMLAFVVFGLIAGFVGDFFNKYKLGLAIISGIFLVFFGLLLLLNKGFSIFNFKSQHIAKKSFVSIFSLGFLFGVGWTPCVGPVLMGIILLAANQASILNGTLLLTVYGLGSIIPLFLLAFFSDRYDFAGMVFLKGKVISFTVLGKKIETHTYNLIGGILLILIGVIMIVYQGTFFFQTTMLNYIPWSMNLWSYLNDSFISSTYLKNPIVNTIGVLIILLLIGYLIKIIFITRNDFKK